MEPEHFSSFTTRRKFIRQAACAALGTAALTNTIRDLRFINAAMAQDSTITTQSTGLHFPRRQRREQPFHPD
jgi:hypothetical protein